MKFNIGDRVRAVNPGAMLTEGGIYTVDGYNFDGLVKLKEVSNVAFFESRFREVGSNMDYPDDLQVRDRLKTKTGREYVVTNVQSGMVTYAYIPAKYDHRSNKKIELDTRRFSDLKWVDRVERSGQTVWPKPEYRVGQTVLFSGKTFKVDKVYGDHGQYLTLSRSVHTRELDK